MLPFPEATLPSGHPLLGIWVSSFHVGAVTDNKAAVNIPGQVADLCLPDGSRHGISCVPSGHLHIFSAEMPNLSAAPFLTGLFVVGFFFLLLSSKSALGMLYIGLTYKYLLSFSRLSFTFLTVSFKAQTCLILMKSFILS